MARATITKAGAEVGVGGKLVKARCYHRKDRPSRFFFAMSLGQECTKIKGESHQEK